MLIVGRMPSSIIVNKGHKVNRKRLFSLGAFLSSGFFLVAATYYFLLGCASNKSGGGGCGSKPATVAQTPAPAPAPAAPGSKPKYRIAAPLLQPVPAGLQAITVAVDDEFLGDGRPLRNPYVVQKLRELLAKAGYRVSAGGGARADVELKLTFTTRNAFGTYLLQVKQDGLLIDTVYGDLSNTPPDHDLDCDGGCADVGVLEAVNALGRSGRLLNLASSRVGTPPVAAARPAAPTPTAQPQDPYGDAPKAQGTFLSAAGQPNAYALIIGIEHYRDVPSPSGAKLDAEQVARLVKATLGVPEQNILLAIDERATRSDIEKQLRWLRQNVPQGGRIYFYFSGHGAPDPTTGTSYIVPYDGDPRFLADTAMQLPEVMKALSLTKARDVLAIVDSCFSGAGGRSVLPPGTRPLVKVKESRATPKVALFAASSGAEISGPAKDGGGLFTTVLLQALGGGRADVDGDGAITLSELLSWVRPRVSREAKRDNREQTPTIVVGEGAPAPNDFVILQGLQTR